MVFILRFGMRKMIVGHELDVSDVKYHMQRLALTEVLKDLYRLFLLVGKGWKGAVIPVPLQRLDVVGIVSRSAQLAAEVYPKY